MGDSRDFRWVPRGFRGFPEHFQVFQTTSDWLQRVLGALQGAKGVPGML